MPEIKFCPYCGRKTVDNGPVRTYCTTCGEDIITEEHLEAALSLVDRLAGEIEDLENEIEGLRG